MSTDASSDDGRPALAYLHTLGALGSLSFNHELVFEDQPSSSLVWVRLTIQSTLVPVCRTPEVTHTLSVEPLESESGLG